jgi:hypothetical protein
MLVMTKTAAGDYAKVSQGILDEISALISSGDYAEPKYIRSLLSKCFPNRKEIDRRCIWNVRVRAKMNLKNSR